MNLGLAEEAPDAPPHVSWADVGAPDVGVLCILVITIHIIAATLRAEQQQHISVSVLLRG